MKHLLKITENQEVTDRRNFLKKIGFGGADDFLRTAYSAGQPLTHRFRIEPRKQRT